MEKLWKKMSLAVVLLFSLMIFAPYPALAEDAAAATVYMDVQVTAADKTYDTSVSAASNLKTDVEKIEVVPESSEDEDLIKEYNVKAVYSGDALFNALTIGDVPVKIDSSKISITSDSSANGKYNFVLGKVLPVIARLNDNGAAAPTLDEEKQQIEDAKTAENILYRKLKIGIGAVPSLDWIGSKAAKEGEEGSIQFSIIPIWEVFSAARSGYKVRDGYYDDWIKNVKSGLAKMEKAGITAQDVKMTEWEKLVLAITAIGYDPRDITYDGENLIGIISNQDYLKVSAQTFSGQYAVMALTSQDYMRSIPQDGNHIDKADIDSTILDYAKSALGTTGADGSAVLANSITDMWIMAFQPIAAYYDVNAENGDEYYDVKQAMDHVFDQISNSQTYLGSFWGGYSDDYNNPWTNAQVYMTLGMSKADIFDSKYIKCGKTMIDAALSRFDVKNNSTVIDSSWYDPTQICRGIDSLVRAYEGRNSIFDCRDVTDSTVPVNNVIEALPAVESITSEDKAQVDAAEASYNALSVPKKASISQDKLDKLTAAEEKVSNSGGDTQAINVTNLLPDVAYKLGDDAKVSVKAENLSDGDQDASLITALYDDTGKFITYASGKQTIKAGDSSVLTSMLKIPAEGTYKLKAFVWDSLEDMNPLSNIIDIPVSGK
jgi:hypothetical protein